MSKDDLKTQREELIEKVAKRLKCSRGEAEGIAADLTGLGSGFGALQIVDKRTIAEKWDKEFEKLKQIDRDFNGEGEFKNLRKAASRRLEVLTMALTDKMQEHLEDPELLEKVPLKEVAQSLKFIVDANVTLMDGHQPAQRGMTLEDVMKAVQLLEQAKQANAKIIEPPQLPPEA